MSLLISKSYQQQQIRIKTKHVPHITFNNNLFYYYHTSIFSLNVTYETERVQQLHVSTDGWLLSVSSKNSIS
jgi:hypothetical protein